MYAEGCLFITNFLRHNIHLYDATHPQYPLREYRYNFDLRYSHNRSESSANCASVSASPRMLSESPIFRSASTTASLLIDNSTWPRNPWSSSGRDPHPSLATHVCSLNMNFSSFTTIFGSVCLVNRITAEPTFGRGIKQFGGTFATIYGSA